MKNETMEAKLLATLKRLHPERFKELDEVKTKVENRNGNIQGITEDEIQEFRAAQGIIYFLQAPELFKHKTCKHCGAQYLVSRLYVAFCSYTCIKVNLEEQGFNWKKGQDLEAIALDKEVFNGNEPLWIRNLPTLAKALEILTSTNSESLLSPAKASSEVKPSSSLPVGTLKRL